MSDQAPNSEDPFRDDWDTLKPGLVLPRLSEADLRTFVLDVLGGRVFTSGQVRDNSLLPMIFMPVALGGFAEYNPDSLKEIGILYEFLDQALPRGINGYPIFASVRIMHRLDWERARKAILAEQERQRSIEIPPDDPVPP